MSDKEEVRRLEQRLVDAVSAALKGPPMTPEQKAQGLADLLNAKSKAMREGREYVLTGIDGEIAHFDVKQSAPAVFVVDVKI